MYTRPVIAELQARVTQDGPRAIQIVAGPRQVGKTTVVRQLLERRPMPSGMYVAVDEPMWSARSGDIAPGTVGITYSARADGGWLAEQWQRAMIAARTWAQMNGADPLPFLLVVDEIQKIVDWPAHVKGLWDRSMADDVRMHVVLLGSAPLLMQKGLAESLAGRFEVIKMNHWSFEEMASAFNVSLEEYIYFGGFPGSSGHIRDEQRWREYIVLGLISPNIERDILQLTRIDKPALLKQLFEVGCSYSGQIVSLDKVRGHLTDAGNVTTLSHYLNLLAEAGLLRGIYKYSDRDLRRRQSPPKFQALNTALMTAPGRYSFQEAKADRSHWGHLVETAVGAHLCNGCAVGTQIHYWREGAFEVDFIVEHHSRLAALEVKTGHATNARRGAAEFSRRRHDCRTWVVGPTGVSLSEFLRYPPEHWVD